MGQENSETTFIMENPKKLALGMEDKSSFELALSEAYKLGTEDALQMSRGRIDLYTGEKAGVGNLVAKYVEEK